MSAHAHGPGRAAAKIHRNVAGTAVPEVRARARAEGTGRRRRRRRRAADPSAHVAGLPGRVPAARHALAGAGARGRGAPGADRRAGVGAAQGGRPHPLGAVHRARSARRLAVNKSDPRTSKGRSMTRNRLLAALVATTACAGAGSRPTNMRELPVTDIERCYQTARGLGNQNLKGSLDLWQYLDEQGDVPAAFVHDAKGLDFAPFMSCLTDLATGSKYESQKVDYLRPNPITCDIGGEGGRARCQKQVIQEATRAPFDERIAQSTLAFAGWATATDKGWGYTYVHKYPDA